MMESVDVSLLRDLQGVLGVSMVTQARFVGEGVWVHSQQKDARRNSTRRWVHQSHSEDGGFPLELPAVAQAVSHSPGGESVAVLCKGTLWGPGNGEGGKGGKGEEAAFVEVRLLLLLSHVMLLLFPHCCCCQYCCGCLMLL